MSAVKAPSGDPERDARAHGGMEEPDVASSWTALSETAAVRTIVSLCAGADRVRARNGSASGGAFDGAPGPSKYRRDVGLAISGISEAECKACVRSNTSADPKATPDRPGRPARGGANVDPLRSAASGEERARARPFRSPTPSMALRIPPLRSKGSHRGSFVGGGVPTRIHYESKLEHDVAAVLLARPDVWRFREQCAQYRVRGHLYTFDALVELRDGQRYLVAIKPSEKVVRTRLRAFLLDLAEHIPPGDADGIVILTERHVPAALVRDAELIRSVRRDRRDRLDDAVLAIMADTIGAVPIGVLAAATGEAGQAFRAVVRRIADGDLAIRSPRPITHATLVARR